MSRAADDKEVACRPIQLSETAQVVPLSDSASLLETLLKEEGAPSAGYERRSSSDRAQHRRRTGSALSYIGTFSGVHPDHHRSLGTTYVKNHSSECVYTSLLF